MIAQLTADLRRWSRAGPIALSCAALAIAAGQADGLGAGPLCGPGASLEIFWQNLQLLDLPAWGAQWLAMLCAMMLPLLILPLEHIARTTFRRDLGRSVGLFVASYVAAWVPAGVLVMLLAMRLQQALAAAEVTAIVALAALAWSASPLAQRARNRAHRSPPLAVHGLAAWLDCVRFGWHTGLWCVTACWPWMLLCEVSRGPRVLILPGIALILLAERAMPPARPRWQLPRVIAFLLALRPYPNLGR